jgi:RNA-binding protein YhbY
MKPIKKFQIGKKGLTTEFVEQMQKTFEKSEMVKIDLLQSSTRDKAEADKLGEDLINKLGNKFTFKRIGYTLVVRRWRKAQR